MDNNLFLASFERELANQLSKIKTYSKNLKDGVSYALLSGGKRIRPLLTHSVASLFDTYPDIMNYAICLELIHNYSLVHDDLPELDNDLYRRDRLTVHAKFGHNYGLLVGDALLNLSFSLALNDILKNNGNINFIKAYNHLFLLSGIEGMIDGQSLEIEDNSLANLNIIHKLKTSNLFKAAMMGPVIMLDKNEIRNDIEFLAENLGIIFQINDDLKDNDGYSLYKSEISIKKNEINDNINKVIDKFNKEKLNTLPLKTIVEKIIK